MPKKTVTLTIWMKRLDDMCTTCWKSGMVSWHSTELRATGVYVGEDHTYCALCRREQREASA